jgi:hypothetical protein
MAASVIEKDDAQPNVDDKECIISSTNHFLQVIIGIATFHMDSLTITK